MIMLQYTNLILRFLLELCVLASLGFWGFHTGKGMPIKIGLGIGSPLLVAVIWGIFGSPGAPIKASGFLHVMLETAVFGAAAIALYASEHRTLALLFAAVAVINRFFMHIWKQ